ncbi:MAG: hypothetical protein OEY61_11395 [Gammaproteobacteria bacterium]|nr:hypothetical protein [Gammaproteobacteria bacterium]
MRNFSKVIMMSLGLWLVAPMSVYASPDDDVTIQMLAPGDDVADVMENIDLPDRDDVDENRDSHDDAKGDDEKDDEKDDGKEDELSDDKDDHEEPLEDHNENEPEEPEESEEVTPLT